MENVDYLFENNSPFVFDIYLKILDAAKAIGPVEIEPKKTSIHLLNNSAFGGVHPKKNWLDFNLVMDHRLEDPRVNKVEQVSKNRFHNYFRFTSCEQVDEKFISMLRGAYELMNK